jgi:cytochrome c biogenesis protein CcdA
MWFVSMPIWLLLLLLGVLLAAAADDTMGRGHGRPATQDRQQTAIAVIHGHTAHPLLGSVTAFVMALSSPCYLPTLPESSSDSA